MSDRNKNKKSQLSDFLRYRSGEMTGTERNAFERELQKDPFTEDAAEGFDMISNEESLSDITKLNKLINKRTSRKRGFVYYRIAASIAVLMVISTLYIIHEKNQQRAQFAESLQEHEPLEIAKTEPLKQPIAGNLNKDIKAPIAGKKTTGSVSQIDIAEAVKEIFVSENKNIAMTVRKDSIPQAAVSPSTIILTEEKHAAPVSMTRSKSISMLNIRGQVITADDNLPIPGASIQVKGSETGAITDASGNFSITLPDTENKTLVASYIGMESKEFAAKSDSQIQVKMESSFTSLDEVVVVGHGVEREKYENEELNSGYIAPKPSIGKQEFEKYIAENIHLPETLTDGKRVVVILSFLVHLNGSIDSIRVVRSPGKQYSDEAIRLIKAGPQWNPAEENGKISEEEVRVRIVFR